MLTVPMGDTPNNSSPPLPVECLHCYTCSDVSLNGNKPSNDSVAPDTAAIRSCKFEGNVFCRSASVCYYASFKGKPFYGMFVLANELAAR